MQLALNLPGPLAAAQSLFLDHGHPVTTSPAIAERFGKIHRNAMRDIEKLLAAMPDPEFSRLNFERSNFTNTRGKTYPAYRLTKNGFALLAMGFTGAEALAWKIAFLQAFDSLEAELAARVEREAGALRHLRPHWPAIAAGTEAGLRRVQICATTGHKSPATITANRRRMRAVGLLAA